MLAKYRKLIAAVAGALVEALSQAGFTGRAQQILTIVVAFLTALGVWGVPNKPLDGGAE